MTLAVVFGGGGARGAFQAGAWEVLAPHLNPRFVIGSSIGAINGVATTRLAPTALASWWRTLDQGVLRDMDQVLWRLVSQPKRRHYPALAVCTPLGQTRVHVVTLAGAPSKQVAWLKASAAFPGVFAPVKVANRLYLDGGLLNDLPVDIAYALGATKVLAITAGGLGPEPKRQADVTLRPTGKLPAMFDFRHPLGLLKAGRQAAAALIKTPAFLALSAHEG